MLNMMIRGLTASSVIRIAGPFRQISALISVAEALLFLAEADDTPIVGALRRVVTRANERASTLDALRLSAENR